MTPADTRQVTVIIATFRRPELLTQAIKSAQQQSHRHVLIRVYDNASGDETEDVVRAIAADDNRVIYVCQPENVGFARNFQSGLDDVSTPFFCFLSDDDWLLPNGMESALAGFARCPEAMFSANRVLLRDEEGRILDANPGWRAGEYLPPEGLFAMLNQGWPLWTGTVFRREIVRNVGVLDPDVVNIDVDFLTRAAAHVPYVLNDAFGAVFSSRSLKQSRGIYRFDDIFPHQLKTIDKIRDDSSLQANVRDRAVGMLNSIYRRALLKIGLQYLYQRRVSEAEQAGALLVERYFGCREQRLLRLCLIFGRLSPNLFSRAIGLLYGLRRRRRKGESDALAQLASAPIVSVRPVSHLRKAAE